MRIAILSLLLALPARALDDDAAAQVIEASRQQLAATASALDDSRSPSYTSASGGWSTVVNTDALNWTQGFFPGAN